MLIIVIVGVIGGALTMGSGSSEGNESLSQEVLGYTAAIKKYANQYGIEEYSSVLQAVMIQESGGRGLDPMQSSACPFNTKYAGAITEPLYSIEVGIQYFALCIEAAKCSSPSDIERLKLSLQGYNFGNGYIAWVQENYGGYSEANVLLFSREQAAAHGWTRYGDPEYVPNVLRYYSEGNIFLGLFGNGRMVEVAKSQIGNIRRVKSMKKQIKRILFIAIASLLIPTIYTINNIVSDNEIDGAQLNGLLAKEYYEQTEEVSDTYDKEGTIAISEDAIDIQLDSALMAYEEQGIDTDQEDLRENIQNKLVSREALYKEALEAGINVIDNYISETKKAVKSTFNYDEYLAFVEEFGSEDKY